LATPGTVQRTMHTAHPGGVPVPEHALRHQLAHEVHARPYEVFAAPVRATHLALATGEAAHGADRDHIAALCRRFTAEEPPPDAIHHSVTLGRFLLRWERHTEFSTCTVYRFDPLDPDEEPFAETALDMVPADWLQHLPGALLVALHVEVRRGEQEGDRGWKRPDLKPIFGDSLVIGSRVGGGAGAAWSDLRIHPDGFGRILVHQEGLTRGQTGRLVQRLVELETYRMMALLAFPVARAMGPQISGLEQRLWEITDAIAGIAARTDVGDERALLGQLTQVAAEVESLAAANGYRFSAARAYRAIVERILNELREQRIGGVQTFAEFYERRFIPAMRTVEAMAERADGLGGRVARASDMLRTRVDIALEENNRDLLRSMNRRADLQLRLQETVEGLSVVAISYYLFNLIVYWLEGTQAFGVTIAAGWKYLIGVPLTVAIVWIGIRRLKAQIQKRVRRGEE